MPETYRYQLLLVESHKGDFTGYLLDPFHPPAAGTSEKEVLTQLREYLLWCWRDEADQPDVPETHSARVFDLKTHIQPQYEQESGRLFACADLIPLKLPCVDARGKEGGFVGILPTLDVRFHYFRHDALKDLAINAVRSKLSTCTPSELARHLPIKSRMIEEIVITAKGRPRKSIRKPWFEDPKIEQLASVAEPVSFRNLRGKFMWAFQRDQEISELARNFRGGRINTLLVGEPGVGKSAILLEVARSLERQMRSEEDRYPHCFWFTNGHRLIAGMQYLGQWEKRGEEVVKELAGIKGVLCVENLLDLIQIGGRGPHDSIAAFLAPYLRREELRLIAETTPAELDTCRRLMPSFVDLFHPFKIEKFEEARSKAVLQEMVSMLSQNLKLDFETGVSTLTYSLYYRFAPYAAFPGKAVGFLIKLWERAASQNSQVISLNSVLAEFARQSGLPELFLRDELTIDRSEVLKQFQSNIIGQEQACEVVADQVTRFKSGMQDTARPISVLIFCGPTGVGKTALARQLSGYFFEQGDDSDRMIRLDMSEYGSPEAATRLITGPAGEPSDFIRRMRQQPFSLVLLDEIEKAHPLVFDVLMNVFDEGRLTDPNGRVTSFCSSIIIMTSNLGATQSGSLGFKEQRPNYEEVVQSFFRPEFFNRMDGVVTFNPLGPETIRQIAEKELAEIAEREGLTAYGIKLSWEPEIVARVAAAGFDGRYGARPLQRTIETLVVTPLAQILAERPQLRNAEVQVVPHGDNQIGIIVIG